MLVEESPEADGRRSIMRTLNRDPYDVWTRDSLARATGLSSGLAGRVLADLVGSGMVRRLPGPDEEYTAAGADY
jgi:DNA-binding MarR family transcriptional regulator